MPSPKTLARGMIAFDIASMIANREWSQDLEEFQYVGFDASPQRPGLEIFVTNERVVKGVDLDAWAPGAPWPEVSVRKLPLGLLGQAKAKLADKVQTHIWQRWLVRGPTIERVRECNLNCRQCLSDMGVEFSICDYIDVVPESLGQSSGSQTRGMLYPRALGTPGLQHIIDNALK